MYYAFYGNKACSIKRNLIHFIVLFVLLLPLPSAALESLEKVTLQLDWKYQFQFAGYIAAKEKGFYKEAGLDVELIEYQNGIDIFNDVIERKVQYGISKSSVFIKDRKIVPIRLLASYFQKSPHVLVTTKAIKSPNDLIGKSIMISDRNLRGSVLAQLFSHFYLNNENTKIVPQTDTMEDLIQHKVDAVSVYSTNEPYELKRRNFAYNIIDPAEYGYVSGAGHLFTSLSESSEQPERSRKLVAATNKGWAYALENEEEIIAIIFDKYSQEKSIEALRFEAAETKKLIQVDSIAIGAINEKLRLDFVKQLKRRNEHKLI